MSGGDDGGGAVHSLDALRQSVVHEVWGEEDPRTRPRTVQRLFDAHDKGAGDERRGDTAAHQHMRSAVDAIEFERELRERRIKRTKEQDAAGAVVLAKVLGERARYARRARHPATDGGQGGRAPPGHGQGELDIGQATRTLYADDARIPYPRELRRDPGVLTRARRRRMAARRRATDRRQPALSGRGDSAEPEERQTVELCLSCSELEGVPTRKGAGSQRGAKLSLCVCAKLLLLREGRWELHGTTEAVRDGTAPYFAKSFLLEAPAGAALESADTTSGRCRVELHYRWGSRASDSAQAAAGETLLGHLEFRLPWLLTTPGRGLATRLPHGARLAVRAVPVSVPNALCEQATLRLRASVAASELPSANLATHFFKVSRELEASASGLSPYELVARSEQMVNTRKHTLGCRDLSLSVHKLCYGDLDEVTLLVELFRYCPLGNHTLLGGAKFKPAQALKYKPPVGGSSAHLSTHTYTRYVSQLTPSGKYALTPLDVSCSSAPVQKSAPQNSGSEAEEDAAEKDEQPALDPLDSESSDDEAEQEQPDTGETSDDDEDTDPFAMLRLALVDPDGKPAGALQVGLGITAPPIQNTTQLGVSQWSSWSSASSQRQGRKPGVSGTLREEADEDFLRSLLQDSPIKHSDHASHAKDMLSYVGARIEASASVEALRSERSAAAALLSQSLNVKRVMKEQLGHETAQTAFESESRRDARLFHLLGSGQRAKRTQRRAKSAGHSRTRESFARRPFEDKADTLVPVEVSTTEAISAALEQLTDMTLHPEERFAASSLLFADGLNAQVAGSDTVMVSVNS